MTQPALTKFQLSNMRCEVIKARDGLELPAYLSLPVGAEPKQLPMILNVHGGPWARDAWGYRPDTQWFTNRGYAVLQVRQCHKYHFALTSPGGVMPSSAADLQD